MKRRAWILLIGMVAIFTLYLLNKERTPVVNPEIKSQQDTIHVVAVGELEKADSNLIDLSSNIKKAAVFFNRKFVGYTPIKLRVPVGKYEITMNKAGYVAKHEVVEVVKDISEQSVKLDLLKGYRYIKGGTFEFHGRKIKVESFYLSETEVTNNEYQKFLNETGHELPFYSEKSEFNQPRQPVLGVNYSDAVEYVKWYSKTVGYTCRLPFEHEWEYAASGGKQIIFPWGDEEKPNGQFMANYHPFDMKQGQLLSLMADGFHYPAPVGSYPATKNNLYDMAGNVFEWMADTLRADKLYLYPEYNLKNAMLEDMRIVKGGSWNFNQNLLGIKQRVFVDGKIRKGNNGFRILLEKD